MIDAQANMVGHQAVRGNFTAEFLIKEHQILPLVSGVTIGGKHNLSVMSSLQNEIRCV